MVVRAMSDGIDPDDFDSDSEDFVKNLVAENTDALGEFTPPDVRGTKPKWWERTPKGKGGKSANGSARERRASKPKTVKPMPRGGLRGPLTQLYVGIGMSVMPFDPSCGRTIIENADKCAEALDELAKTNTAIRNFLIGLCTTSAWGAVLMAHAPIVMAIAMHHVPALKKQQEKMVGEFAEMMANGFKPKAEGDED
jgi:hypothetical protein